MVEYKLYKSRRKAFKLILGSGAFVAIGIVLLLKGKSNITMCWLAIGFFGLCLLMGIYQLLDRRPQIIINEAGIFDRIANKKLINWELIHDAYLLNMNKQVFICLVVDHEFEPSYHQGPFKKKMAKLSKAIGFQELNVSLGNVDVNAERLAEFILTMRSADHSGRHALLQKHIGGK